MSGVKEVVIRYRTKRGEKRKLRVPDVPHAVDQVLAQLAVAHCYDITRGDR